MRSPRVFFSLDPRRHEELSARARQSGVPPNALARDMFLAALDGDGAPLALGPKIEALLGGVSGDPETSTLAQLRDQLSSLHEHLSLDSSGPGHDALWDLLETVLEWAVRTCVCVDHLVGLQVNDRDRYRQFNRKTAETTRRLLAAALRGQDDG